MKFLRNIISVTALLMVSIMGSMQSAEAVNDQTQQVGPVSVTLSDPCVSGSGRDAVLKVDATVINTSNQTVSQIGIGGGGTSYVFFDLAAGDSFTINDVPQYIGNGSKTATYSVVVSNDADPENPYRATFTFDTSKPALKNYPAC